MEIESTMLWGITYIQENLVGNIKSLAVTRQIQKTWRIFNKTLNYSLAKIESQDQVIMKNICIEPDTNQRFMINKLSK